MPKKTISQWKANRRHAITLPSGFEVSIEIPNLAVLVKTGQLPNALVQQAIGAVQAGKLTAEAIAEQADFYAKLVCATVKEPAVTEADVVGDEPIPFEDIEMLVEIATRQRDLDALGHHIAGLHTSKDWRNFRGLSSVYEDVEGVPSE
jgi:hypothetical protein